MLSCSIFTQRTHMFHIILFHIYTKDTHVPCYPVPYLHKGHTCSILSWSIFTQRTHMFHTILFHIYIKDTHVPCYPVLYLYKEPSFILPCYIQKKTYYCQPLTIRPPVHPCNVVFNVKSPLGDTKPNNFSPFFCSPVTESKHFYYCEQNIFI